jgi:hypothetical protein
MKVRLESDVKWYHFWDVRSGVGGEIVLGLLAAVLAIVVGTVWVVIQEHLWRL